MTNALFELFGVRVLSNVKPGKSCYNRTKEETQNEYERLVKDNPDNIYYLDEDSNRISCIKDFAGLADQVDSAILWAVVEHNNYFDRDKSVILKSKRTRDDILEFINSLRSIEYYDGFGAQELFGTVVFKDGSWLTRGEYDGSEWWERHLLPVEPDWSDWDNTEPV